MDLDALVNDFPVLDTGRLILRRLAPADLADAITFFADPDIGRYTTWCRPGLPLRCRRSARLCRTTTGGGRDGGWAYALRKEGA